MPNPPAEDWPQQPAGTTPAIMSASERVKSDRFFMFNSPM
jgi:hypothetical protein